MVKDLCTYHIVLDSTWHEIITGRDAGYVGCSITMHVMCLMCCRVLAHNCSHMPIPV